MTHDFPHGCWPSAFSAKQVSQQSLQPREIVLDGDDLYWLESRPTQQGRTDVMRCIAGREPVSCLPPAYDCRSRVHEYGGGAYTVSHGYLFFSHYSDNQLYSLQIGGSEAPLLLSSGDPDLRYAALHVDESRERLLAVREDHRQTGEAINSIVSIPLNERSTAQSLVQGDDFYATPLVSPDGRQLCWLSWSHPGMPWESTTLWLATFNALGRVTAARAIAGGRGESVCQPSWSPGGELYFISDRSGWWNLVRWRDNEVEPVAPSTTEFAIPQWVFGQSNYAFLDEQVIIASRCRSGQWELVKITSHNGHIEPLASPYNQISQLRANSRAAYFIAASAYASAGVVRLARTSKKYRDMRPADSACPARDSVSVARAISFSSKGGVHAHGLYYPPVNPAAEGPRNEKPPLLVIAHGGPTGAASPGYDPMVQFWTSRGFAVLAVNYRGSANYGRAFRGQLDGQWGIADAQDCVSGAQYLAEQGLVDPLRMAIRGNSAGGYTVLSALVFHDVFAAGASYYGISDLERLAQDTHKFESRYMDSLLGPYPACREIYRQRSAVNHIGNIRRPLIFFQGLLDKVVPPNQSRIMAQALREQNVAVAELNFPDEGHGFRHAENVSTALLAELHFYGLVFGFQPADPLRDDIRSILSGVRRG